jgi:hypothetical protein
VPSEEETTAALQTIQLENAEIEFLSSAEIAGIAPTTPRAVKRMVNVYRLARARLSEDGHPIMGDPPSYPIIALMVAIETGQLANMADAFYAILPTLPDSQSLEPLISNTSLHGDATAETADARKTVVGAPGLKSAIRAVLDRRANRLVTGDVLSVARVVRRYSFNSPNPK